MSLKKRVIDTRWERTINSQVQEPVLDHGIGWQELIVQPSRTCELYISSLSSSCRLSAGRASGAGQHFVGNLHCTVGITKYRPRAWHNDLPRGAGQIDRKFDGLRLASCSREVLQCFYTRMLEEKTLTSFSLIVVGISLLALWVSDVILKKYHLKGRYFVLHAVGNGIACVLTFKGMMATLLDPKSCVDGPPTVCTRFLLCFGATAKVFFRWLGCVLSRRFTFTMSLHFSLFRILNGCIIF